MAAPEAALIKAYGDLTTRLSSLVKEAKKAGRTTAYLEGQLFEVRTALARVEGAETEFAARQVAKEYRTSAADAQYTIKAGDAKLLTNQFSGFDRRAVRALQTRVSGRLTGFRRALTEGLVLGDPRLAIPGILKTLEGKSNLTKVVGGQLKVVTPSGKFWDPKAYARMLGRTAIADTRRVAFRQRYLQNGLDVVKVVANGTVHSVCAAWEGERLSLTGETAGLKTVADARAAGLFHPNCRHRYVMDREYYEKEKAAVPDKLLPVKPPEQALPILGKPPPKVSGAVKAAVKKVALKAPKAALAAAKAIPKPKVPKPAVKILELEEIKIVELPPLAPVHPTKQAAALAAKPKVVVKPKVVPTIKPVKKLKKPAVKKAAAVTDEIDELLKYEMTGELAAVHEKQLSGWLRELLDEKSVAGIEFGSSARLKLKSDYIAYQGKIRAARKMKNKTARQLTLRQNNERFSVKMHTHAGNTGLLRAEPGKVFEAISKTGPLPKASLSIDPRKSFDSPEIKRTLRKRQNYRQRRDLTESHMAGVSQYTGSGYTRINRQLRKPKAHKDANVSRAIGKIDEAINASTADLDLVVYRGTGGKNPARMGNYKVGFEYDDAGFGSFGADRGTTSSFLFSQEKAGSGVLIRMRLRKGDKALWVSTSEHEFLLPRGMRYRIVAVEDGVQIGTRVDVRRKVVTVEIVQPAKAARRKAA